MLRSAVLLFSRLHKDFDFSDLCQQIGDVLLALVLVFEKNYDEDPIRTFFAIGFCYFVLYPITVTFMQGVLWLLRKLVSRPLAILKYICTVAAEILLTPIWILSDTVRFINWIWQKYNWQLVPFELQQDGTISNKEWKALKQYHKKHFKYYDESQPKYNPIYNPMYDYNLFYNWGRGDFVDDVQLRYRSSMYNSKQHHKEKHRKVMDQLIANHACQISSEKAEYQEKLQAFKNRHNQKVDQLEGFLRRNCNIADDLMLEVTRMCRELRSRTHN